MADTTQVLTREQHLERIKQLALRLQNGQFKTPAEVQEAKQEILNFAQEVGLPVNLEIGELIKQVVNTVNSILLGETTTAAVPKTLPELLKELDLREQELEKQRLINRQYDLPTLQQQLDRQAQFHQNLFNQLRAKGLNTDTARLATQQIMRDLTMNNAPVTPQRLQDIITQAVKVYTPNETAAVKIANEVIKAPITAEKVPTKIEQQPTPLVPAGLREAQRVPSTEPINVSQPKTERPTVKTLRKGSILNIPPAPTPIPSPKEPIPVSFSQIISLEVNNDPKLIKTIQDQVQKTISQNPQFANKPLDQPTVTKILEEALVVAGIPVSVANDRANKIASKPQFTEIIREITQKPTTTVFQASNKTETNIPLRSEPVQTISKPIEQSVSPINSIDNIQNLDMVINTNAIGRISGEIGKLGVATNDEVREKLSTIALETVVKVKNNLSGGERQTLEYATRLEEEFKKTGIQYTKKQIWDLAEGLHQKTNSLETSQTVSPLQKTKRKPTERDQEYFNHIFQEAVFITDTYQHPKDYPLLKSNIETIYHQVRAGLGQIPYFQIHPELLDAQTQSITAQMVCNDQLRTPSGVRMYSYILERQLINAGVTEGPLIDSFSQNISSLGNSFWTGNLSPTRLVGSQLAKEGKSVVGGFLKNNFAGIGAKFAGIGTKLAKVGGWLSKALGIGGKAAVAIPVVGQVIAIASTAFTLLKPFLKKIFSKLAIFLARHKDDLWGLLGGLGAVAGGVLLLPIAPILGILGIGLGGTWAGITGFNALGGALGGSNAGLSGTINGALSGTGNFLTNASSLGTVANVAEVGIFGSFAGIAAVTAVTITGLAAAFYIPSTERMSPFDSNSQYIQVEKTVSFNGKPVEKLANSDITDDTNLTYTISITANGGDLTEIKISDIATSSQEAGGYTVADKQWDKIPGITKSNTYSFEYPIQTKPAYKFLDAVVNNTVVVTATVTLTDSNGTITTVSNQKSSTQIDLIIGNPPEDCPMGWPISQPFTITQEPGDSYSHSGIEAIDLAVGIGTQVRATHAGTAITDYIEHPILGKYITIQGLCKGKAFSSIYAHLSSILITNGATVHSGTPIGLTGNTGNSTGPHLHYQLKGLKINDYTPSH